MTLTFFSNFLNHHQKPLCDYFYDALGEHFRFVSTIKIPQQFIKSGYDDLSTVPYNINSYQGTHSYKEALRLGLESDIVITGSAPEEFIKTRLAADKITFRYGERDFKKGNYQKFDPRVFRNLFLKHTRYRRKNLYMLCNSGYKANDMAWVFAYPKKIFKWGYFPATKHLDVDSLIDNKKGNKTLKLLYVSRLIAWKHPEMALELANRLNQHRYDFSLDIIGSGPLENKLKQMSADLNLKKTVNFLGNMANQEVVNKMRDANIFIFTSDRNEGWGAVANEAMGSACALVASHMIGAMPFLINNGVNGLIFKSKDNDDLFVKVQKLMEDRNLCEQLGRNAYTTITTSWSAKTASHNFLLFAQGLLDKQSIEILEGPCSAAHPTSKNWYKK